MDSYKKFISVKNTIPEAHVIINKAFLKNLNTLLAINTKKQAQQVFEAFKKSTVILEKQWLEEKIKEHQLVLHADNGGSMKGATMLVTLQKLGVVPSFSRPKVSDDNPFSESLFKTLKYWVTYVKMAVSKGQPF